MGQKTGIAWCDHTFNPWIGCTKVSPGCFHCYAEADDKHWRGGKNWGPHGTRTRTSVSNWKLPFKWNAAAKKAGIRRRVFCASMADVFEDRRDLDPWRKDLWELIERTPNLDWLLLTKRPENVVKLAKPEWIVDTSTLWPANVWLGVTCENQQYADLRIPVLLALQANYKIVTTFVSYEPALDPLNQISYRGNAPNWLICGGESGPGARPMDIEWAYDALDLCRQNGTAFFMKQLGGVREKWDELEYFPEDLRVREFPK